MSARQSTTRWPTRRPRASLLTAMLLAASAACVFGCSKKVDEATAGEGKSKGASKEVYRVELPKLSLASGASAEAPVAIRAEKGWKWNVEYPARVEASAKGGVEVSPAKLDTT